MVFLLRLFRGPFCAVLRIDLNTIHPTAVPAAHSALPSSILGSTVCLSSCPKLDAKGAESSTGVFRLDLC